MTLAPSFCSGMVVLLAAIFVAGDLPASPTSTDIASIRVHTHERTKKDPRRTHKTAAIPQ